MSKERQAGMNGKLKTHKDLDAWKDFGLWTHEPRLSTLDSRLVLCYLSFITALSMKSRSGSARSKT
jgi:hypothetical protein